VVEVNLLRQQVKVRMEDAPDTVSQFSVEDIEVLRNGKAKKNDPPIPPDLAPISGSGKRVRKEKKEEPVFLDPIKFRYREEAVVEQDVAAQPDEEEPKHGASRNRRRKPRSEGDKPHGEERKEKPKAEDGKPEDVPGDKTSKPNNRRRNHYRRKPKANGGTQE
jgi:hypothetical protein